MIRSYQKFLLFREPPAELQSLCQQLNSLLRRELHIVDLASFLHGYLKLARAARPQGLQRNKIPVEPSVRHLQTRGIVRRDPFSSDRKDPLVPGES